MLRFKIVAIVLLLPIIQYAQNITLVTPKQEVNVVTNAKQFITGTTCKTCNISINGAPVKVYQTGAFAFAVNLTKPTNEFILIANEGKKSVIKKIIYKYNAPLPNVEKDSAIIESIFTEPNGNLQLAAEEIITFKVKAKPNCQILLNDKYEVKEIPKNKTNGIGGFYQVSYKLKESDTLFNKKWKLTLLQKNVVKQIKLVPNEISVWNNNISIIGSTNMNYTPMYTGLGEDRLGGTKAGFLDKDVPIEIIGSVGKLYKVQLSKSLYVFINKEHVDIDDTNKLPTSLTNNITVIGDSLYDYIKVNLNNKLPYITNAIAHPNHLILTIYGATSNSNWLMQFPETLQEIKDVELTQIANNELQIKVDLKNETLWGFKNYYEGNTLVLQVRRQKQLLNINNLTIAIDAGHGGNNNGAIGIAGKYEKEFTLLIAKEVEKILNAEGAKVIMTRNSDISYENQERLTMLRKKMPDIAIGIHLNSAADPLRVKGVSTYYKYNAMKSLSAAIYKTVQQTGLIGWGNIGNFNFYLNSATEFPSALVETLFISNPEDEEKVYDPFFRKLFAQKIVDGIKDWLKSMEK